jgi:glutathione synthase/RimK-type ligase-like ATP-grasp enzyme
MNLKRGSKGAVFFDFFFPFYDFSLLRAAEQEGGMVINKTERCALCPFVYNQSR